MAGSKTPKASNNNVSTKKRDQVFEIIDAIQNSRWREASTQLKDLLDPVHDFQNQNGIAKCSSKAIDSESPGACTKTSLQKYWRLPFRWLSLQVYAIIREESALTGSFDSALRRLDLCLVEHPKQARKLADERKTLQSKGTNDIRAWIKASDDQLQQSFEKRAKLALQDEALLSGDSQILAAIATPAADNPLKHDEDLESPDNNASHCDDSKSNSACQKYEHLGDTQNRVYSPEVSGGQDTVSFDDDLWDNSNDVEPLHHNANRRASALTSPESSQICAGLLERSALCIWKRGAGRKKSWKSCPTQKLPTRRKHKGYRQSTSSIEEASPPDSSPSTKELSAPDSAADVKLEQQDRNGRRVHNSRPAMEFKRSGRQESAWTWNRIPARLGDGLDDLMPIEHWTLMRSYPRECKSTKIVIHRTEMDEDHESSRTLKKSPRLPKPVKVKTRLLIFSSPEVSSSQPMLEGNFVRERMSYESLLLSIPENLPGSSTKKQKRRGINKLKIPEFSNAEQLLSFLRASWPNLLERLTEMRNSLPHGWEGTPESYSRRRRTLQAWKKQLEDLEPIHTLAKKLEMRYHRTDALVRREVKKLEAYAAWVDQSQSALMDLSWIMRKQPGVALVTNGPLLDPSEYSELMRHGIIRYTDDFTFHSSHWAIQGISVFMRVTKAYREWCQMSENLIKSLLNSRKTVAT